MNAAARALCAAAALLAPVHAQRHPHRSPCTGPMAANSDLQGLLASGQWNVASGKPVVSDTAVGDAAGITDGRSGSGHRWESAATPKPHWLVVDLGEVYWIEGVNLYVGDCEAGCESTCRSDEGLCSFKVEAWTGPATTLARVQSAATGWVSAGHSHKGEVTQSVAKLNIPPVQTRYVKIVVEQGDCPALSAAAVINELQVIECPLCLIAPGLPDPDAAVPDAEVNTYGHTLIGFWALDDHTLRDYAGGDDNADIHGNVIVTRDPARGPVLEFFGTPNSYVEVPPSPQFDLNVYSVMFWMKATQLDRKQAIFSHGESFGTDENADADNTDKAQYIIFLKEDGHIQHWSESAGEDQGSGNAHVSTATDFYSSSDFELRMYDWVHVAVTRGEDNAVMFYVNGQLDSHHTPETGFNDPHIQHQLTFGTPRNNLFAQPASLILTIWRMAQARGRTGAGATRTGRTGSPGCWTTSVSSPWRSRRPRSSRSTRRARGSCATPPR